METNNIETLNNFTIDNLPNLDVVVMGALELFEKVEVPKIDLSIYKRPLVVGSGNGEVTGRIIFCETDAVFASESDFEEKLQNIDAIDLVALISASGKKHAPVIVEAAHKFNKKVMLITNSYDSPAAKLLNKENGDNELVFPKNREPYTYNTSTYMSMIFGVTGEDPTKIKNFIIDSTSKLNFPDFSKYDKYFIMVPSKFRDVAKMIDTKFVEHFSRNIARDVVTFEVAKHAMTIAPAENELFISFGEQNNVWGAEGDRFFVPLPEDCGYAAMIAIGYYIEGQIQKTYPHFFKDNITKYTQQVSEVFDQELGPIVEGNQN